MAQILISSLKINCIHSGGVVNIGDIIFSLPSNRINLSAGDNSLCSGDGITAVAQKERQAINEGTRYSSSEPAGRIG